MGQTEAFESLRNAGRRRRLGREVNVGWLGDDVMKQWFPKERKNGIATCLRETSFIAVRELSRDQERIINERFDYLEGASRRLTRKDFVLAFWGTMFSFFVTCAFPADKVRNLIVSAFGALARLLR